MKLLTMQFDVLYCGRRAVQTITYADKYRAASAVYSAPLAALIAGNALTRERAHTLGVERGLIRGAK